MHRSLLEAASALGVVAVLSGCSKEKPLTLPFHVVTATVGVGAVTDATACSEFADAYRKFQAGTLPNNGTEDRWSELQDALDAIYSGEMLFKQLPDDIDAVQTDAMEIDLEAGPTASDPKDLGMFDKDVAEVGKDCGTTFTPMGDI